MKSIKIRIQGSIWVLVYVKRNNYFPDKKTKTPTSGVWLCKLGYPWRFSYYAGKDFDTAMKYYGKYEVIEG